ncbi:TonB-dependent receptor [uncultured Acinetobacter sp.]|uniref:TonB-dependent receptor plug domain-containing protein n=1 Tax=uncultured Acinetobacter sp. TaxID=165433 RepID=UPI0025839B1B|nr:TonB-dependent receptor [uncultured Acinetobacter sp.]
MAMGFSSTTVFADDSTDATQLDPIVVTASKSEEKASAVPARITIIQPQILEQSPIASLPDLLMTEAAINMVQSGGYGQSASIFLRGAESDQTLILRDGVRLNSNSSGAAALPFIDTTDIKQIEILKGPASVLYGTDAIGGVVQLVTRVPTKSSVFTTNEVGENKTYKSLVGADIAENGFYAQIRGQRLETDGTPVKETVDAPNASFDQKGFSTKFGVEKENFAASIDYSKNKGNSAYDNSGNLTNQDFQNEVINLKGKFNFTDQIELNTRLSQFKDDTEQKDANYLGTYDFVHSKTQEAEIYNKWNFTNNQNLMIGITHRKNEGDVVSFGSPYKEDVNSTGYFIQHQYNQSGLNTQVGVRLEDNEKFGTHTVAQGAIRYQLLPLTSVYANIGSAFKAPTLNDLYGFGGNQDLKPEESLSYEIGFDQQLAYNIRTGLSLYTTKVDNLINYGISQMENVDKAKFEGAEAYIKWQGENLYTNLGFNYVRSKDENTGEDLSRRPRQNISLTTGWQDEKYALSATVVANSKYDNTAYDTVSVPGHLRIDMHGQYTINEHLQVFSNIQNIGDVKYRTAYSSGSYYINGGRLASVGVTLKY